ncbi:MAG TPA: cupin domain-containing protein [Hanamia sp.]|jgi:mannose-6-phosphate isomerase-like protein (cupin superfamily)|nr:cupin domain-containing protein [Hanamia sp.]
MNNVVSKYQPLKYYQWGNECDGWNLVENGGLSVKQELMPTGASEQLHYHKHSQQFFFILAGTATFEIEGKQIEVSVHEGLQILAGEKHRIINKGKTNLEFILCSQPSVLNDRINIEL